MVRVGTLNVENLFARYRFRKNIDPSKLEGFSVNETAFELYDHDSRKLTAKLIKLMDADVLALQEVENAAVLKRFASKYLRSEGYKYQALIEGNDLRKIDVAVLSRYPIEHIRSYAHERTASKRAWVFSRDCLELDIRVGSNLLRLYVNHFKSMIGGRSRTKTRRKLQADRVAEIIDESWSDIEYDGNYIVLGDFNDYPSDGSALNDLIDHSFLENVIDRLPEDDRWTHYWASGKQYSQLDYILLSKDLSLKNFKTMPEIFRQGLPYRADKYTGKRIKGVGENNPKASDHAGVVMEVKLK